MVLSLALGVLFFALATSLLTLRMPVQAQDPPPDGPEWPIGPDPRTLADAELPIRVSVNTALDLIEEGYEYPGATVWITVTSESGVTKATIELQTELIPGWEGRRGFSTDRGTWVPEKPDIVPGDLVEARSSIGHSTSMRVGTITGYINTATNIVTGTVYAPWVPSPDVEVKCRAYHPLTPESYAQRFSTLTGRSTIPDGEDVYTCDFSEAGYSQWLLRPGHVVQVSYDPLEPYTRSNRTLDVFAVPGPYLQIRKWVSGAPGVLGTPPDAIHGHLVFNVEYRNIGPVDANQVTITDQMSSGLRYLGDTSGVTPSGSGSGPITWLLPTVPAGTVARFQIFAAIDAASGGLSNEITIASNTTNMGLDSERRSTWNGTIQSNGAWMSVSKRTWSPNPLPGTDFVYETEVCNTGFRWAVDSSMATLTETLPDNATLVDWWSEHGGWVEASRNSTQLVLTRQSIAARGCTKVYLRVRVPTTAQPGDQLCSAAQIQAANNNNTGAAQINVCSAVGYAEPNLAIDKRWAGGTLVPGGEIAYEVEVRNSGNVPLSGAIRITDTLPTGATFLGAELDPDSPASFNLTPVQQMGNQIVWQIAALDAGYWSRFTVRFRLDESIAVGTPLVNTVEVGLAGLDEDTTDNVATSTEQVQGPGPNLRVSKTGVWASPGARLDRINYRLTVENVGDIGVYDPVVTDIYDSRMTLATGLRIHAWETTQLLSPAGPNSFAVQMGFLKPGARYDIDFATTTAPEPVAAGMIFTNTATIGPLHLETDTADNTTVVTTFSGPDLEVMKTFEAGVTQPGELVSFLLTYRNAIPAGYWWWGLKGEAQLTDTLPEGLEFVSAELWRCGATTWCAAPPTSVAGQQLTWNVGSLRAGEVNVLRVTARIGSAVAHQTQLVNRASIASSSNEDAEAYTANNVSSATVTVSTEPGAQHTLDVTVIGEGTVAKSPDKAAYEAGEQVQLTATPAAGWLFAGWSGDATGTDPQLLVTITGDTAVTATFVETPLAVSKAVMPVRGVGPGGVVTYTITLENTGTEPLTGIEMVDVLPDGVTFAGFAAGTNITPNPVVMNNTISWTGDLGAGVQPAVIIFTATLATENFPYLTTITNHAEFTLPANGGGVAVAEASFTTIPQTTIYLPIIHREAGR
jgi:uncharacterized repeat protein (TIGR01451 family)/uncharacterized repeat protein (TIGR02543 family)